MIRYRIDKQQLQAFRKKANRLGAMGLEACGLLVLEGNQLLMVPVTNATREMGCFQLTERFCSIALAAQGLSAQRIVGWYHSHPASRAAPGETDISGAFEGSLMLIYSRFYEETMLWRIRDGAAKHVRFMQTIRTAEC